MKQYPSIFNDVLGPVMRGPSSSHSAASLRIGRMARDLMNADLNHVLVEYDPNGSLVTTHESQGSDMGLFGGLLGWETNDARLENYLDGVNQAGLKIDIEYLSYGAKHPNNYKLTLKNQSETHTMQAISTGGGMIIVEEIDGAAVHMGGDFYETLIYLSEDNQQSMLSSYDVENQNYAIISGFEMPNVSQQIYGLKFISSTSNSALIEWSTTKAGSGELRCNEVGGQNDIAVIPWQSESLTNTMTITNLSTAKNYQCFVSVGNITSEMLEFTTSSEIDATPPDLLNLDAFILDDDMLLFEDLIQALFLS